MLSPEVVHARLLELYLQAKRTFTLNFTSLIGFNITNSFIIIYNVKILDILRLTW